MSLPVKLYPPSLVPNYCISTVNGGLQGFVNLIFLGAQAEITTSGSIAKIIVSPTAPGPDQRDYVWVRESNGTIEGIYEYKAGAWSRPHPVPPGSGEMKIWKGAAVDIDAIDGGDSNPPGDSTGPFWAIDTDASAKFLLGVGTLPSGAVVAVTNTGGHETVPIAKTNLPTDKILVTLPIVGQAGVGTDVRVVGNTYGSDPVAGSGRAVDGTDTDLSGRYLPKGQSDALGDGTELNVMPPYLGVYFLKRTSRVYIVAI